MKKRKKPSKTRRHRESVREKRRARAFYFERQAAKGDTEFKDSRWNALADVCRTILVGLAAACIICSITQLLMELIKELMK